MKYQTTKVDIESLRDSAFQYISSMHKKYGHFPMFDFYPNFEEKKNRGWHYMYRSPFIHCSTLDSLLNAGFDEDNELIREASRMLLEFREPGDLWRFWDVDEAEYPTFSDVDETSISSFALQKLGIELNNKEILYSRIKDTGEIPTWIYSDFRIFLINPKVYFWLLFKNKKVKPILNDYKWITLGDAEPTIAANVLAYLGENSKTKKMLKYVIQAWQNGSNDHFQHYDKEIIFAFHIARAFKEGVNSLIELKESLIHFIQDNLEEFSFPEILMGYLSIFYYDANHPFLKSICQKIENELLKSDIFMEPYPYTTEKKKIYYGGSGVLTSAWFLEVTKSWK